jgi:hypothetical protein
LRFSDIARRWVCLVGGTLLVLFGRVVDPSFADDAGWNEFTKQVSLLSAELAPIPSWKGVGYSPRFVALTAQYSIYIDDCIRYLSQRDRTATERGVALMLMARLSLEDEISFARKLLTLYDHGDISDGELMVAITPHVQIVPSVLFDNYYDPDVRSLYDDVLRV